MLYKIVSLHRQGRAFKGERPKDLAWKEKLKGHFKETVSRHTETFDLGSIEARCGTEYKFQSGTATLTAAIYTSGMDYNTGKLVFSVKASKAIRGCQLFDLMMSKPFLTSESEQNGICGTWKNSPEFRSNLDQFVRALENEFESLGGIPYDRLDDDEHCEKVLKAVSATWTAKRCFEYGYKKVFIAIIEFDRDTNITEVHLDFQKASEKSISFNPLYDVYPSDD